MNRIKIYSLGIILLLSPSFSSTLFAAEEADQGIEEVIEVDLNTKEQDALSKSVDSVIELLEIMEENS